jgi:hypothetical protein
MLVRTLEMTQRAERKASTEAIQKNRDCFAIARNDKAESTQVEAHA